MEKQTAVPDDGSFHHLDTYLLLLSMYGVLIAFKRFSYKEGIWGSPWVGLENFQFLFNYNGVGRVFLTRYS